MKNKDKTLILIGIAMLFIPLSSSIIGMKNALLIIHFIGVVILIGYTLLYVDKKQRDEK